MHAAINTALSVKGWGHICPFFLLVLKNQQTHKIASKFDQQFSSYVQFSCPRNTETAVTETAVKIKGQLSLITSVFTMTHISTMLHQLLSSSASVFAQTHRLKIHRLTHTHRQNLLHSEWPFNFKWATFYNTCTKVHSFKCSSVLLVHRHAALCKRFNWQWHKHISINYDQLVQEIVITKCITITDCTMCLISFLHSCKLYLRLRSKKLVTTTTATTEFIAAKINQLKQWTF